MEMQPIPGVYKHIRGGFYQLLFVAKLKADIATSDVDLCVYVDGAPDGYSAPLGPFVSPDLTDGRDYALTLATARAHGPMRSGDVVCVYVPLYADKPGRRISVRPLAEWEERQAIACKTGFADGCTTDPEKGHYVARFEYVGQTVPQKSPAAHNLTDTLIATGSYSAMFATIRKVADEEHHKVHPVRSNDCDVCEALDATEPGSC